jgi:hypothetical protein
VYKKRSLVQIPLSADVEPAYAQLILRIIYAFSAIALGSGVVAYVAGHGETFKFALSWLKLVQLLYMFCQLGVFLPAVPGASSSDCQEGYPVISRLKIGLSYFALHGGSLLRRPPPGTSSFCVPLLDDSSGHDFLSTLVNMLTFLLAYSAPWALVMLWRRSKLVLERCSGTKPSAAAVSGNRSAPPRKGSMNGRKGSVNGRSMTMAAEAARILWSSPPGFAERSDYFVGLLLLLDASAPGLAMSFGRLVATGSAHCIMYGVLSMIPPTLYDSHHCLASAAAPRPPPRWVPCGTAVHSAAHCAQTQCYPCGRTSSVLALACAVLS